MFMSFVAQDNRRARFQVEGNAYCSCSQSLMHTIIWLLLAGGIQQTSYPYLNEHKQSLLTSQ